MYEFVLLSTNHVLPENVAALIFQILLTEVLYYISVFLPIGVVFIVFSFINTKFANGFLVFITAVFQLLGFLLGHYFSITNVPLGSDFWGYSFGDITETVSSSGGISPASILLLIVVSLVIIYLPIISRKIQIPKYFQFVLCAIFIIAPVIWLKVRPKPNTSATEQDYFISVNKTHYFLAKSKDYYFQKSENYQPLSEYPFYKKSEYNNVLGEYFSMKEKQPNIVFIIVEGLGSDFVTGGEYSGFTPFIDSLSNRGIFFKNMLSTTGRTFGVLPSLLGSLPLGEDGFMELGTGMPNHRTLISILRENKYKTRFYYGGDAGFDKIAEFLERQKIDEIIDEGHFPDSYKKSESNKDGFTWGYADGDVFKFSLENINALSDSPYLNIYLTLSTHEPFLPPNKKYYENEFENKIKNSGFSDERKNKYRAYTSVFESLLYTDASIKKFIDDYSKRADFSNTIFIITGDHRIIPVPQQTKIDRFHVPLIIFSSLLKKTAIIHSVSSHLDITPTILSLLHENYEMNLPDSVHWLGSAVDTTIQFRSTKKIAFMRSKGEVSDFLNGEYFLSEKQLYNLTPSFSLVPENNSDRFTDLPDELENYKQLNSYVTKQDKLMPSDRSVLRPEYSAFEDSVYSYYFKQFPDSDRLFEKARLLAFSGNYTDSRIICNRLLGTNSNFHDARTLLARTFAWEKKYNEARNEINKIIKRAPKYSDAYFALAQIEFWDDHTELARINIQKAISINSENVEFLLFDARLSFSAGDRKNALLSVEKCLKIQPDFQDATELKNKILEK